MFVYPFMSPPCVSSKFDLIHCDLWTSLVVSVSCYKYYLVVTNTIWLQLMIALTTCALFLYDSDLKLSICLLSSSPTSPHNLALASRLSSATMGTSLTTPAPATSSSPKASIYASLAPTPRLKMVKLNALFAPSIMSFAHCSFRRLCLPPSGWRPSPWRLCCLRSCPPRLYSYPHLTLPCTACRRCMITYESSTASVIQICPPPLLINSLLGLPCASS